MDVGRASHGGRVAKLGGDLLDRLVHNPGRVALAGRLVADRKRLGCQHRTAERAEVLGAVAFACRLAQVLVDVRGSHVAHLAGLVAIGEQLLAVKLLTASDDPCNPPVDDPDVVHLPRLARVVE